MGVSGNKWARAPPAFIIDALLHIPSTPWIDKQRRRRAEVWRRQWASVTRTEAGTSPKFWGSIKLVLRYQEVLVLTVSVRQLHVRQLTPGITRCLESPIPGGA